MAIMQYIVIGTGRCGSSAAAKALRDRGVFIGEAFVPANKNNPDGFWEDIRFADLNNALLLDRSISLHKWRDAIKRLIEDRNNHYDNWGFKHPAACHLLPQYLELMPEARFIRITRPEEDIIASMMRCFNWSYKQAADLTQTRIKLMDEHLPADRTLMVPCDKIQELLDGYVIGAG